MLLTRHLPASVLALGLMLTNYVPLALGAPNGRTVSGTVTLPPPAERRAAPQRGEGFVPRAKNPLRPPDGRDPRRKIVVFLQGGKVDPVDLKPRSSRYNIVGENFDSEILPVVVGGKIEIKNLGRKSPRLYSTSNPDLIPGDPINKKGVRVTQPIHEKYEPIDVRDQDSVHFLAHIVAFEYGYFSVLDSQGTFKIEGVPAGNWKVRLWYGDGWATNTPPTSVTVPSKRDPKPVTLRLPVKLSVGSPAP